MRIKKENEWKAAFSMLKNAFELIVMFFGLTNLLVTFQAIVRNRPATEPVTLKVHNVKLSFDIWLVLYMYFILYS